MFKLIYTLILIVLFESSVTAQLHVGSGDSIFIASGEKLFIGEDLNIENGGSINNASINGIELTGTANLNGAIAYSAVGDQHLLPFNHRVLQIGGTGNKWMQSDILIDNRLQLGGNAKLITGNYLLTLSGSATTLNGIQPIGSAATSWIVTGNGNAGLGNTGLGGLKIEAIGASGRNTAVLFPVGPTPGNYNPVTLFNTGTTDDFIVRVSDQVVPGVPALKSVNNTWNISEGTVGGSIVALTTQWNLSDEASNFIRAVSGVVHSNGTTVDQHAGMGMALGSNPFTRTGTGFRNFSPFGVTSDARVLPVTWINLNAHIQDANIAVQFAVAAQQGITFYEIQKSIDGRNFISIGQLPALSAAGATQQYQWNDVQPNNGTNIYRIKSIGINGAISYSNTVRIEFTGKLPSITAYPNPVTDHRVYLNFKNYKAGLYTVTLMNATGAKVYRTNINHNGTNAIYLIELPYALARGMYHTEITSGQSAPVQIELLIHQ